MRIFLSAVFIVGSLLLSQSVGAQEQETTELSPEKIIDIKASCVGVQVVLQKIKYNDAANRVNRGQGYESLVTRMIIPMNSRAAVNGFSNSAASLANITSRYQQSFKNFKKNYDNYDDALNSTLRIKCQEKSTEFYTHLTEARKYRTNLANDITSLTQIMEEYRQAVVKLKDEV